MQRQVVRGSPRMARHGMLMPLMNGIVVISLALQNQLFDLFEEEDLHAFVDMLFKFILQVQKQDGSYYPPYLVSS